MSEDSKELCRMALIFNLGNAGGALAGLGAAWFTMATYAAKNQCKADSTPEETLRGLWQATKTTLEQAVEDQAKRFHDAQA